MGHYTRCQWEAVHPMRSQISHGVRLGIAHERFFTPCDTVWDMSHGMSHGTDVLRGFVWDFLRDFLRGYNPCDTLWDMPWDIQ